MINMRLKLVLLVLAAIGGIEAAAPILRNANTRTAAQPINHQADKIPNIDDLLAVAKSPLEPVTMAMSMPGARNDNQSLEQERATTKGVVFAGEHQQTSRSANFIEQERDATTSGELPSAEDNTEAPTNNSSATEAPQPSSEQPADEGVKVEEAPKETQTEKAIISSSTEKEPEAATTAAAESSSTTSEEPVAGPEVSTSSSVKEQEESTTESVVKSEPSSSEPSSTEVASSEPTTTPSEIPAKPELTTTEPVRSEPTTTSGPSTTSTAAVEITSTEAERVASVEIATTTEQPEPTTLRPIPSITEISIEVSSVTTEAAAVESSTVNEPAETPPKVGDDSVVEEKPTEAPPAREEPAQPSPTTTTTEVVPSTTSTTTAPEEPEPVSTTTSTARPLEATTAQPEAASKETPAPEPEPAPAPAPAKESAAKPASCNHLPSYESEELQKVFREETTYKNGTIKGKFTYINFDQRYRLVHYTRLPYGPVKIDLVEELGKPERPGQKPDLSSPSEIPNAVLQLRNILPNSLFGFPFLSQIPSSPMNQHQAGGAGGLTNKDLGSKDDKSSQYFYSTDSISTPNLLTPSVPVSLLPPSNQHPRPSGSSNGIPAADTLSQSYYDNLPVGQVATPANNKPATNQFQYSVSTSHPESQAPKAGVVFAYSQPRYQYSPLPLSWQNFYSNQQAADQQAGLLIPTPEVGGEKLAPLPALFPAQPEHSQQQQQQHQIDSLAMERTHQPHSHEHFIAPFMYTNPRLSQQQATSEVGQKDLLQDEPETRLKLRVKTSKSLNHQEAHGKSAQLKTSQQQEQQQTQQQHTSGSASYLQSPVYSPAQLHRSEQRNHRQRVGKQHFEVRTPINTNPIVYHVLRSPIGKMYTLSQYNNLPYSLA